MLENTGKENFAQNGTFEQFSVLKCMSVFENPVLDLLPQEVVSASGLVCFQASCKAINDSL